MKHPKIIVILLLLMPLLVLSARADDSPANTQPAKSGNDTSNTVNDVASSLGVPSLVLGPSYDQGTFKMWSGDSKAQLTDNGRSALIFDFVTPEHVLFDWPMKQSNAVFGINFIGSFGQQHTRYQNIPGGSGIIGQDIGSSVSGDYLAASPFVSLRLGPIYPGTDSYWMFGYGLGGAFYHFSGNPVFYATQANGQIIATSTQIGSSSKLFLYQTWRWQFHWGHWDVRFEGRMLNNEKVAGYNTSYENYGLGVTYTIKF
jgi:hypothetical protein